MSGLLSNYLCYQVGSIDFSPDGGRGWRQDMKEFLHSLDIGVFDPTSKPVSFLDETVDSVQYLNQLKKDGDYEQLALLMKDIVSIDLHFLDLSNFIIAYLDWDVRLTGSITELSYAALEKKPCIVISPQGKGEISNWLFGMLDHNLFFESIEEAQDYLIKVDKGEAELGKWRHIDYKKVFKQ